MKLLLVIDVADDVAESYDDFTVDYDLRGTPKEDRTVNESIKYVEDCPLKPMPEKKDIDDPSLTYDTVDNYIGFNECIEELEK